jgi:hypothetical protein
MYRITLLALAASIAGCATSNSPPAFVGGAMPSEVDDVALRAARINILALRATVKPSDQLRRDVLLLNGLQQSLTEAIKDLATSPKPLHCSGSVDGNRLAVTCKTNREPLQPSDWQALLTYDAAEVEDFLRKMVGPAREARLLLFDEDEPVIFEGSLYSHWLHDYSVSGLACSIIPMQQPGQFNADARVEFSPVGDSILAVDVRPPPDDGEIK